MVKEKPQKTKDLSDEEVEKIFNSVWENWSSRRKCENTHKPNYLKKQEK